jgi:peptidoglycan/xylan/chitin deacetylase (PgdA/CDA1 family)
MRPRAGAHAARPVTRVTKLGRAMTIKRRVLLAVGGLMLLSSCSDDSSPGNGDADGSPVPSELETSSPTPNPTQHLHGKPEYYVSKGPDAIALTLDDGPHPTWTPQVLAVLEKYKVTAAFSQVGSQVHAHPGLVKEVAQRGHVIVNHTWTHADLVRLSATETRDQISRTSDAVEKAAGQRPTIFRAPYGAWSDTTFGVCRKLGLRPLDWSVDPRDWARPGSDMIVRTILARTRTGSIILEHDGGGDRSQTVAALRVVIPKLLDEGYHFVTP